MGDAVLVPKTIATSNHQQCSHCLLHADCTRCVLRRFHKSTRLRERKPRVGITRATTTVCFEQQLPSPTQHHPCTPHQLTQPSIRPLQSLTQLSYTGSKHKSSSINTESGDQSLAPIPHPRLAQRKRRRTTGMFAITPKAWKHPNLERPAANPQSQPADRPADRHSHKRKRQGCRQFAQSH